MSFCFGVLFVCLFFALASLVTHLTEIMAAWGKVYGPSKWCLIFYSLFFFRKEEKETDNLCYTAPLFSIGFKSIMYINQGSMKKCPGVTCFLLQSAWKDPVGFYYRLGESSYYEKQEWSDTDTWTLVLSAKRTKNNKPPAALDPKEKNRNMFLKFISAATNGILNICLTCDSLFRLICVINYSQRKLKQHHWSL